MAVVPRAGNQEIVAQRLDHPLQDVAVVLGIGNVAAVAHIPHH